MATEMVVGATQAHPGIFPEGFGIGRRSEPRNEYLGLVTTWPERVADWMRSRGLLERK